MFEKVDYLVEATSTEQQWLWEKFHKYTGPWKNEVGKIPTVGTYHKRPITCTYSPVVIDTKRIVFYYSESELVDWKMVEKFTKQFFPNVPKEDSKSFGSVLVDLGFDLTKYREDLKRSWQ